MRTFRDRRGFTLPLTIIVIVVIGILASTFYGMVKSERIETFHRFQETQAWSTPPPTAPSVFPWSSLKTALLPG